VGLQLLVILTLASFATAILTLMTGFTRIVIVLSFVRNAVGTPQTPPTQVIIGLSLILTFFVMAPVWNNVNENALRPYLEGEIPQYEALSRIEQDVRGFMFKQTREKDLALFVHLSEMDQPDTPADVPTHVLIPAYAISELRTAFQMGFVLFVPFLVIDLVVSSMLMAMGMMMLPPSMISLPFKILLFVMVDGWHVIVRSLVESFVR
jgi:flagellar biosynthetic protein FliP